MNESNRLGPSIPVAAMVAGMSWATLYGVQVRTGVLLFKGSRPLGFCSSLTCSAPGKNRRIKAILLSTTMWWQDVM